MHDLAPPRPEQEDDPFGVELLAVGAGRAVVEARDERRRPRRARPEDVQQLPLRAGGDEVLQEQLDGRLAAVLAGPSVVALAEGGLEPRRDAADEEGAGGDAPGRRRR
jgi:hypothetical protein